MSTRMHGPAHSGPAASTPGRADRTLTPHLRDVAQRVAGTCEPRRHDRRRLRLEPALNDTTGRRRPSIAHSASSAGPRPARSWDSTGSDSSTARARARSVRAADGRPLPAPPSAADAAARRARPASPRPSSRRSRGHASAPGRSRRAARASAGSCPRAGSPATATARRTRCCPAARWPRGGAAPCRPAPRRRTSPTTSRRPSAKRPRPAYGS